MGEQSPDQGTTTNAIVKEAPALTSSFNRPGNRASAAMGDLADAARPLPATAADKPDPEASGASDARSDGGDRGGDPRTVAAILRSAPDGVVLFDEAGQIVDWSPAAERILGYPRGRVVGRDLLSLLFPDRIREAMRGVIENRADGWGDAADSTIEVGLTSADGEDVPVQISLSWAEGPRLFAAHFRDGRERSERERQLAAVARRRSRLLGLGQISLDQSGLATLVERTLETAVEEVGFKTCELWELDADSGELILLGRSPDRADAGQASVNDRVVPAEGSKLADALLDGETSVVLGDRLLPDPSLGPQSASEDAPPGAAAIILGQNGPLGALTGVGSPGQVFSTADTAHLESLAQILSAAIERDRYTASLAEAETRLRTLVERLPAVTYRAGLGSSGHWHYISPQIEEILGFNAADCMADHLWWERQVHPDDLSRVLAEEDRCALEGRALDVEYRMFDRDGRILWIRDRASTGRPGERGEIVVEGIFADMTSQKAAEDRLRHLADHDHLTDLLNRRGFEAAVDRSLARMKDPRGALAIIDLDHLKLINDSLGHAAGDAILKELGSLMAGRLGPNQLIGRLSGDEFGLFAPGIDEGGARAMMGELISLIRRREGGPMLTASAGVTLLEDSTRSLDASDLLVSADLALYEAKQAGRDRVAFSNQTDTDRLEWVGQIREAITAGRLVLYSQPIFDMRTGEQCSEELLVRMIDADGGHVAAGQFIPTAERFGLIGAVDHWVIERAVDVIAAGRPASVNISAASIADIELTELVARRFEEVGAADPSMLTFEITETVATPSIEILRDFANRVDTLGCGLSLDDVGTGFGSLTYLQNLQFTELKIDMQFIRGILESETDAGIVRSLVVIAGELGLKTVGEGVEDERVLRKLEELGVDRAQGYHFGQPRPVGVATAR